MDSKKRKNILAAIPWVKKLSTPESCIAQTAKAYSSQKRYKEALANPSLHQCTRKGWYKFTALQKSDAKSGVYCRQHLVRMITHYMDEEKRFHKWWSSHPEYWRSK